MRTGLRISPAMADAAETVRTLVHDAYRPYIPRIGRPPGPMVDDYAARIAARQVWRADGPDGDLHGILVLEDQPDGTLLLDNIAVRPDRQGTGVGRALMTFAESEARRRGHGRIRLYTHETMVENIALYRRVGYVETGRVTEKGFARVYMEKTLA